jgi:L-sorbose 1-phosphate reductase
MKGIVVAKLDDYQELAAPLPESYTAWQLFGAGLENVGKDGVPQTLPLREPAEHEVLLRVDAMGICLSDIKIINQGGSHARLRGRDLPNDPTVLGHECSVTVVKAGDKWKDHFKPGQRYIVQADVYVGGVGYAFGYMIPGGMQQFCYVDDKLLAGDEGCYLLPVEDSVGYSQAALTEPWACVEMSYCLEERFDVQGDTLVEAEEKKLWHAKFPDAAIISADLHGLSDRAFDTIIVTRLTKSIVEALAGKLRKKGVMFLLGKHDGDETVSLDVGRIHYEDLRYFGGGNDLAAVKAANDRNDLLPGGTALFLGAGGPMGQMHVQRAIEIEKHSGLVVVTDLDRGRLDHIEQRFGELAKKRGITLVTIAPSQFESPQAMDAEIRRLAPRGYDDVVLLAPVAALVKSAMDYAADNALVNIFAGLVIGTMVDIKIKDICRGVKMIGSSGSRIRDLEKVLSMVEHGELDTNLSVAAICGLNAARDGLQAVKEAKYPGKTVIYTQIHDLPLMSLDEVPERLPELKDKLGPQQTWTKEAEQALLEKHLP